MERESESTIELENHVDHLLQEIERQDWAKTELARQGQQMMKALFLGMSGVVAAIAAFGTGTIPGSECAVLLPGQCLYMAYLVSFALAMGVLSSLFYTLISGLDFVAPYSVVESRDTRDILRENMTGKQYYQNRIGVLANRVGRNRKHIRALEIFGSLGGSSFVMSLFFTALTIYASVFGPIGAGWSLLLAVLLLLILVGSHFAIPKSLRRREPSPFSYFG